MYLAKNQDDYEFALSSSDFKEWSGLGARAYTTAFEELKSKGYLIALNDSETIYCFRDKLDIEPPQKIISTKEKYAPTQYTNGFVY